MLDRFRRVLVAMTLAAVAAGFPLAEAAGAGLRFVVALDEALPAQPAGRLLVVLVPAGRSAAEPRFLIGRTGPGAAPIFGVDAPPLAPGDRAVVGGAAAAFPVDPASERRAGKQDICAHCLRS